MKKYLYILSLIFFAACQVISPEEQIIPIDQSITENTVLLVEFSGVGCVNCPLAATQAQQLSAAYNNLTVVQMHPKSNPFTTAMDQYDYTSLAADEYYKYFGGTASTPFPTGVIDFTPFGESYFIDYTLWGEQIIKQLSQTPKADFSLTTLTNSQTRQVSITISDLTEQLPSGSKMILWLTEDSIVGAQLMPDGSINMNYIHNHILRQTITDVWGETPANTEKQYVVPQEYDINNCSIIAVLLDENNRLLATRHSRLNPLTDIPLTFSVNNIGMITHDTTIVIDQVQLNPISGKQEMQIEGMMVYNGTFSVIIEREDILPQDQFCCSGRCINTNSEKVQELSFAINGIAEWYAHFVAQKSGEYKITYILNAKSINPIKLTVIYQYNID